MTLSESLNLVTVQLTTEEVQLINTILLRVGQSPSEKLGLEFADLQKKWWKLHSACSVLHNIGATFA